MLAPLRSLAFRRVWTASGISALGDVLLFLAVPYHVYDVTGSALASGAAFAVEAAPAIVLGPLAGVFVDRWDTRRTMVVTDLAQAALVGAFLLAAPGGAIWPVYLLLFVLAGVTQFSRAASEAIFPRLIPAEHLTAANSLHVLSQDVLKLVGPLLGGAILAAQGLSAVLVVDAVTFTVSAAIMAATTLPRRAVAAADTSVRWIRGFVADLREGWRHAATDRPLRVGFTMFAVLAVASGAFNALLAPLVKSELGGSATEFGWLIAAHGLGGIVGGVGLSLLRRPPSPRVLVPIALGLLACGTFAMAASSSLGVVVVMFGAVSVPLVASGVVLRSVLQSAPDHLRGRVFATLGALTATAGVLGSAAGGAGGDSIGVRASFGAIGVVILAAAGVATLLPDSSAPVQRGARGPEPVGVSPRGATSPTGGG